MICRIQRLADPRRLWIAVTALAAAATLVWPSVVPAQERTKVTVMVGQSITHRITGSVQTVSIANTEVADVVVLGAHEILINGKKIGMTTLVIWDSGDHSTSLDLVVRGAFSEQKIELLVQLAEVNQTKAHEYGFDYLFQTDRLNDDVTAGLFPGKVATPQIPLAIFDGQQVENADFALRWVHGMEDISTMVTALKSNGVIRVLAEPNLVAASGEKANFLSGGEIPVPIASSGTTGGSTVTIEWKEFGVKVDFLPTIVDEGVINLKIAPEVSSLDFGNGIVLSGFQIPALRTRRATTTVELRNRETLVIGGLLMEEETKFESKVPILGDIPLLGYLFRSERVAKTTNELLLVVSPRIVRALPEGTRVPLPTDEPEPEQQQQGQAGDDNEG
jgi:Flp pilus assembly secretin CpaC